MRRLAALILYLAVLSCSSPIEQGIVRHGFVEVSRGTRTVPFMQASVATYVEGQSPVHDRRLCQITIDSLCYRTDQAHERTVVVRLYTFNPPGKSEKDKQVVQLLTIDDPEGAMSMDTRRAIRRLLIDAGRAGMGNVTGRLQKHASIRSGSAPGLNGFYRPYIRFPDEPDALATRVEHLLIVPSKRHQAEAEANQRLASAR